MSDNLRYGGSTQQEVRRSPRSEATQPDLWGRPTPVRNALPGVPRSRKKGGHHFFHGEESPCFFILYATCRGVHPRILAARAITHPADASAVCSSSRSIPRVEGAVHFPPRGHRGRRPPRRYRLDPDGGGVPQLASAYPLAGSHRGVAGGRVVRAAAVLRRNDTPGAVPGRVSMASTEGRDDLG